LQAKAKWQRLVERHFPPTAPHMAAQQNQHSGGASGGTASRGGRGGNNNTRPSRGGGSGGTNRGGGNAGQGFANRTSRVNPRPSNAGPPAKVRITVKEISPAEKWENHEIYLETGRKEKRNMNGSGSGGRIRAVQHSQSGPRY
jgi:hypothetical protein